MALPPEAGRASPLSSPSPLLLRLPPRLRERIYRHLGLASWDDRRPHRFFLHAGQLKLRHGREFPEPRFVPDPACFHGLLLSCRTIYAEAAALLYSANQFILYYSEPRADPGQPTSLSPLHLLHTLTATSLRSLSNLKVILNESACHQLTRNDYAGMCCVRGREDVDVVRWGLFRCKREHQGIHQLPLLSPASAGDDGEELEATHAVLKEWHLAATRLFAHTAPGRLTLSLVCDIQPQHPQGIDVANSVLAPIRLLPPSHLRELNVRLAKTRDGRLQQLAQDAVSHACGIPTPLSRISTTSMQPASRATATLATLPSELRVRILEYTDLVTPRRQVIWSRQDYAYTICHNRFDPDDSPDIGYSSQFFDCWRDKSFDGNGCFCRRDHAAFSLACKCWAPPGPALFLVSRALCEDAQFVFFSGNRFTIHDYTAFPPWELPLSGRHQEEGPGPTDPYPYERLAISEFLRDVVPARSLADLRFLELAFPLYRPHSWPGTLHPAMRDWQVAVDWLQDKLNPQGLTIRLVVAEPNGAPTWYYRTITVNEGQMIISAYIDLLLSLKQLAKCGLSRFYARLAYPMEQTEEVKSYSSDLDRVALVWQGKDDLKTDSEQLVMGPRYESLYASGEEEPSLSDWYVNCYFCELIVLHNIRRLLAEGLSL